MSKAEILIVDDTPTNLNLLGQMLSSQGYVVRAVTSGERALESVRLRLPDLILLDIRMPGLNGYDVCETLKKEPLTSDIPVIFISAMDDIQDKVRGFRAGGVDYITKPFQLEEVLARSETHLSMRTLHRQLLDANRKMAAELTLAGQMQANFMPRRLPTPAGWEFSAALKPARETSGDFFDVFKLPDGRLGILIADVVDKGVGAALFMAYTWSLIRTYADERPGSPEWVFGQVNRRIFIDTGSDQFVTIFYGVLTPELGELIYSNAGHLPPIILSSDEAGQVTRLRRTGMPLGVFEDQQWAQAIVHISRGDLVLLYTDGITDAVDSEYEIFGDKRLLDTLLLEKNQPVQHTQEAILTAVQRFVNGFPQFDDMALILVKNNLQTPAVKFKI